MRSLCFRMKAVRDVFEDLDYVKLNKLEDVFFSNLDDSYVKFSFVFNLREVCFLKTLGYNYFSRKSRDFSSFSFPFGYYSFNFALYNFFLTPINEFYSDRFSFGFRPYRSSFDGFLFLNKNLFFNFNKVFSLKLKIDSIFNSLSIVWLLKNCPLNKNILKSWLFNIRSSNLFLDTNIYSLISYSTLFFSLVNFILNGLLRIIMSYNVLVSRNFDSMLISGCNLSNLFNVVDLIKRFLVLRGLFLDSNYFDLKSIYEGFDFLGWQFIRTRSNFLLLNIPFDVLFEYKRKLRFIVKASFSISALQLLLLLNKEISNWVFFYVSSANFISLSYEIDFYLYKLLWKWARRRHPRRPNSWIYLKYWKFINGKWNFFVFDPNTGGFFTLKSHFSPRFKFYTLPSCLNVFSLLNENKIDLVFFKKFSYRLNGLYYFLWKKQYGLCAACNKFLFVNDVSSIKLFRISTKIEKNFLNNFLQFVLLHKFCYYRF
uniref:putative group II intron reverse transcriptase/maturase RoaA n=1 Tax=Flexiglena variabilis TaxID=2743688 RepID=UPI0023AAF636|nr:putative group II intron reverse transcriptase/maturase RoaA [Flexiglena variabilis]WCH63516.1 putative group II intron reverse transcriptase/maturase RoaA [Flexiglena variabilis]